MKQPETHNGPYDGRNSVSKRIGKTVRATQFWGALALLFLFAPAALSSPEGIAAFERGDMRGAKTQFMDALKQNPQDTLALTYMGKIAMREGNLGLAEEYMETAVKLDPQNAEIQYGFGRVMGRQAQDASLFSAPGYAKKSFRAFKRAVSLDSSVVEYHEGLMGYYLYAPGILGGDEDLAKAEAIAIGKIDPAQGFYALASVYQSTNEEEALAALYQKAEDTFPENGRVFYSRGLYLQSQKKFALAVADFQVAQRLQPQDEKDTTRYSALYQIGRTSVLSGDNLERGIAAMKLFIDTAPVNSQLPGKDWANFRLGLLYAKRGDKVQANDLFKKAKDLAQDKTLLKMLKKELRKVR